MFRPLGLLQVLTTKLKLIEWLLMKNCDVRYLFKDKTHPNQSIMSKNFYNHMTDMWQSHDWHVTISILQIPLAQILLESITIAW